jgi:hypothetical protein
VGVVGLFRGVTVPPSFRKIAPLVVPVENLQGSALKEYIAGATRDQNVLGLALLQTFLIVRGVRGLP